MPLLRRATAFLLWPLALAAVTAALLAQGGRFSARLDLLTHFAPHYLAGALVALAGAALVPRHCRVGLAAVAASAAAASAALLVPEFLPRSAEPRARADAKGQIKVIQFNAWTGNVSPDRAAAWLIAQQPDIVVMQEGVLIKEKLKAAGFFVACSGCGAVIFTRQKAKWSAGLAPRDPRTNFLAAASYRDAQGEYIVAGAHRVWPLRFRRDAKEAEGLRSYLSRLPKDRMILAGDFNSTGWSFARARDDRGIGLIRRTHGLPTWPAARLSHNRLPAWFAYLPIDHIYAGPGWATVKVERGPALGSDHYPVVVTLAPVDPAAK